MGSLIGQGIVGIVLPALLALILNGLVLRAALAESRKWPFIGLIIAGCFAFSYSVLLGGIAFPPREATHWLPFIAVGAHYSEFPQLADAAVIALVEERDQAMTRAPKD